MYYGAYEELIEKLGVETSQNIKGQNAALDAYDTETLFTYQGRTISFVSPEKYGTVDPAVVLGSNWEFAAEAYEAEDYADYFRRTERPDYAEGLDALHKIQYLFEGLVITEEMELPEILTPKL